MKSKYCPNCGARMESRPVWGAWIEIKGWYKLGSKSIVAPRMGRVD